MSKAPVRKHQALLKRAREAGNAAGKAAAPTPMVVGTPTHPLGNDLDPTKKMYFVEGGVCGFAWVNVSPGTSSFARYLVKVGAARRSYDGGVDIWVSQYGQSMQRKEAHARAMAEVLRDGGVKAYASSRMD